MTRIQFPQLHDHDWLYQQYVVAGKTHKEIAALVGCTPGAVYLRLKRLGIPIQKTGLTSNSSQYPKLHNEKWLREQYITLRRSTMEIAQEVGSSQGAVWHHLREFGIPRRTRWPAGKWKLRICERCGVEYKPSGPAARFCSPTCRSGTRPCEYCGQDFRLPDPKNSRYPLSKKRFCSKDCLYAWRKDNIVRLPTYSLRTNNEGYVEINIGPPRGRVKMHSLVMEQKLGRELHPFEEVHHLNGIRHDNRPENLELWTKPQPSGQRPEDLARWVIEVYPDLVHELLREYDQAHQQQK